MSLDTKEVNPPQPLPYASPPAAVPEKTPGYMPPVENSLTARGVFKTFRMGETEVVVLKGADLEVKAGEFVAIEGRSGSGKSTLLHVLAGLDAADLGTIYAGTDEIGALASAVDRGRRWAQSWLRPKSKLIRVILWPAGVVFGWLAEGIFNSILVAVTSRPDRQLSQIRNRYFGFVFQFYHLLPEMNVLENTMLAPSIDKSFKVSGDSRARQKQRAIDLLTQFGLQDRLKHLPSQLSGGERQRVAIARALMNSPKVLFADEPTGNLDAETGRQIMDVLEALHRDHGQTIVMVTHDRSLAREADRVLVLKDGKLQPASTAGMTNDEIRMTNQ
jgi:ABC-type lipoprotein export system ATPase subunit